MRPSSAPDLFTLTPVLHGFATQIPIDRAVPLRRVDGIACVPPRESCLPTNVCPRPPFTSDGFHSHLRRPAVPAPSNDLDSRVIVGLSCLKYVVESPQHSIHPPLNGIFFSLSDEVDQSTQCHSVMYPGTICWSSNESASGVLINVLT